MGFNGVEFASLEFIEVSCDNKVNTIHVLLLLLWPIFHNLVNFSKFNIFFIFN